MKIRGNLIAGKNPVQKLSAAGLKALRLLASIQRNPKLGNSHRAALHNFRNVTARTLNHPVD
jgi:hypothetical protein